MAGSLARGDGDGDGDGDGNGDGNGNGNGNGNGTCALLHGWSRPYKNHYPANESMAKLSRLLFYNALPPWPDRRSGRGAIS